MQTPLIKDTSYHSASRKAMPQSRCHWLMSRDQALLCQSAYDVGRAPISISNVHRRLMPISLLAVVACRSTQDIGIHLALYFSFLISFARLSYLCIWSSLLAVFAVADTRPPSDTLPPTFHLSDHLCLPQIAPADREYPINNTWCVT